MDMNAPAVPDALDLVLIRALQQGLPLVPRPYAEIAKRLGLSEAEVTSRLARLMDAGAIKRFGVVVRHRELGYRANAMVVWALPEERLAEIGLRIGRLPFVTLCYRRRAHPPVWPYNLYTMIHGRDRTSVLDRLDQIKSGLDLHQAVCEVLFSARRFKQRGACYDAHPPPAAPDSRGPEACSEPRQKSMSGRAGAL
jgi:DNA-binding Lrp family transcriptional regulator